ncbi:MAG: flagellar hook protein FlgE [Actinobacteria bacterium]|nr:flagellar hook protein FlgE [Actinomycetota bacterium]
MMRSMFSAVSGLRNHQVRMDVIGNNIANVNTVGFKGSRVTFQDMVYELTKAASAPSEGLGGSNAHQVGLGMMVRSVDTLMTQGSLESTGKSTDLAIQGDGFFVLDTGQGKVFSRVGAFDVNLKKDLVDPATGYYVMGWTKGNNAAKPTVIDTSMKPTHINIPMGQLMLAKATSNVTFTGNLDADEITGYKANATVQVYDSQGTAHNLTFAFTKNATANTWDYAITTVAPTSITSGGTGTLKFNTDGSINLTAPPTGSTIPALVVNPGNGASAINVALDFARAIQFASDKSDIAARYQDGFPMGVLENFFIGVDGVITGTFTNGMNQELARVGLGVFGNPAGLLKAGANAFKQSNNSGELHYGAPATGANGTLVSGSLEMSNVDLSREFTNMIITQRGFQANSRIISTSDEMLQELVNLKR